MLGSVTRKDVTSRGLLLPMHPAGCRQAHITIGLSTTKHRQTLHLCRTRRRAQVVGQWTHSILPKGSVLDLQPWTFTRSIAAASTSAIALLEKTTHLHTHEATRSPHRLEGTMLRCIPREQWPFFVVIPVDTRRSGLHTTLRIPAGSAFSQAGRVPPGGHSTGHAARLA